MNVNELMIGDWIDFKGHIAKVDNLRDDVDWIGIQLDSGSLPVLKDSVNPIPISREILEQNGFEVDMYSTLKIDNEKWLEYYHHEYRLRMWWKGVDEWENHSVVTLLSFQCHVWYVHELQHALRLAKIEKEIKL